MRPFGGAASLFALLCLLAADGPARAAWDNVFQVSFFRNRRIARLAPACCPPAAPVVAAAPPACPCPCPCPQPVCTTQYVQRSFYQPVTTFQQRTVLEPVTTYQTSYYCEPVCSYRYSCYFDPCTCSYQQVATPVTSYRLRSRCNAVTTYLQRCQMVPVTSYKLSCYYEPVTTCSTPAVPAVPSVPAAPPAQPGVGEDPGQSATPLKPRVGEFPGGTALPRQRETPPPPMPPADGSALRQPPGVPAAPRPPRVRLDRVVALPDPNLQGQVVREGTRTPQAGARLVFVNADVDGAQQSATADGQGRFRANLPSGNWLVYVRNGDGIPVFQAKVRVGEREARQVTLVSR